MGETNSTQLLKLFNITLIFITVKHLELTNHDPLLTLMINCKAETIHSFSQKNYDLT